MTKRHYFQSLIIFIATTFLIRTVLELSWIEAVLLVLLAIICVLHTMDIMTDIEHRRVQRYLKKKEEKNE